MNTFPDDDAIFRMCVEDAALDFYREHGSISYPLLRSQRMSGLSDAIKSYPGGMDAIRILVAQRMQGEDIKPDKPLPEDVKRANKYLRNLLFGDDQGRSHMAGKEADL